MVYKILTFLLCVSCLFAECVGAKETDIRVVAFDFGGVIAQADTKLMSSFLKDSFGISKEELSVALKEMQISMSKGGSEKQYWEEYALRKKITLPNDWLTQWGEVIKKSITEIPGTLNIVKSLQLGGYQTAMLSDVTQYQAEIIRKMGYYDLFNPVLLSYQINVKKPDPEAFKLLLKTIDQPISGVLFIDDRQENIDAAKKLGIDSILFTSPEQLKKELQERGFNLA